MLTPFGIYSGIIGNAVCNRDAHTGQCNVGFGPTANTSTTDDWTDAATSGSAAYGWSDFTASIDSMMGMDDEPRYNYNVIDVDYENYALVYSCYENMLGTEEMVWMLGRTPQMKLSVYHDLQDRLAELVPTYD